MTVFKQVAQGADVIASTGIVFWQQRAGCNARPARLTPSVDFTNYWQRRRDATI
jgi:hypothetical protein